MSGRGRQATRLLRAPLPFFDHDHLATVVHAAIRADVMRPLHFVAMAARYELNRFNEVMPAAVALAVPAHSLLW
jgi:hypothetical protein